MILGVLPFASISRGRCDVCSEDTGRIVYQVPGLEWCWVHAACGEEMVRLAVVHMGCGLRAVGDALR